MDNFFPFTFFYYCDFHFVDKSEYEYENLLNMKGNQMLPFFDVQITYHKIHSFKMYNSVFLTYSQSCAAINTI